MSLAKFMKKKLGEASKSKAGKAIKDVAAKGIVAGTKGAAYGAVGKDLAVKAAKKNPGKLAAGSALAGYLAGDMDDDDQPKKKKKRAYLED